jgi:hypothetical protein
VTRWAPFAGRRDWTVCMGLCPLAFSFSAYRKRGHSAYSICEDEIHQKFLGYAELETTQAYAESTTAMIRGYYQKALGR